MLKAYKGHIIYTEDADCFKAVENGYVIVEENGKVVGVYKELPMDVSHYDVVDYGNKLIVPGFVDLHFHAPQYTNLGLGLDKELLPWLTEYTFPEEAKYSDLGYAETVYKNVVRDLWRYGTTRIVLLSTLHREGTEKLMQLIDQAGIGAYVGKVNMDRNSPEYLCETTDHSLEETEKWIENTESLYKQVKPIITPRFVPTCTEQLMSGLGKLAEKYHLPIQSHISENLGECDWVKELHPSAGNYADVYWQNGLLGPKTIMAHCVHNTDEEIALFRECGTYAAHCPNANYNLSSGIMPVRKFMNAGVHVGLGTDVGAGHKISISSVMSSAVQASKMAWMYFDKSFAPLTTSEVFYLGTKGGGSFFGKVGSFEEGYEFDALVIDDSQLGDQTNRSLEERLQRYIYIGDDRQIQHRFVSGNELMEPFLEK